MMEKIFSVAGYQDAPFDHIDKHAPIFRWTWRVTKNGRPCAERYNTEAEAQRVADRANALMLPAYR